MTVTKQGIIRPNYTLTVLSIAMVLFLLGLFALVLFHVRKAGEWFKEEINFVLELQDDLPDTTHLELLTQLKAAPSVKANTVRFISKEEGMAQLQTEIGEELALLEMTNPLYNVIMFHPHAAYVTEDSLQQLQQRWQQVPSVRAVSYQKSSVAPLLFWTKKVSYWLLGLGFLFLLIAFHLIHTTVKLSLYANRFLIKNMQLVGARWGFIIRPYLWRGFFNGLLGSFMALIALSALLFFLQNQFPALQMWQDIYSFVAILVALSILGCVLSVLSTYWVVRKYLRFAYEALY